MSSRLLSRWFTLRVKTGYLLYKFLETLRVVSRERAELLVVSRVSRRTLAGGVRVVPSRVLLLLPHCLQHHECPHRVTYSIGNCLRCGKCQVGGLAEIADEFRVQTRVTTGGTLARRLLKELDPHLVVAVACPRDLGQGILDALPLPAVGVLNRRPRGDCFDTTVSVSEVRSVLERVVAGESISNPEGCSPSEGTD